MARQLGEAAQSGRSALQVVCNFISRTLDPAEPELAALSEIGLLDQAARETVLGIFEAVVARLRPRGRAGVDSGPSILQEAASSWSRDRTFALCPS